MGSEVNYVSLLNDVAGIKAILINSNYGIEKCETELLRPMHSYKKLIKLMYHF
jgi:hypothetical protein